MPNLSTDFKNDILNESVNSKRKFRQIQNDDGTYSYEDMTTYSQVGSEFGAEEVNEERDEINRHTELLGDTDISGIGDGTVTGAIAGLNGNINDMGEKFVYEGRIVTLDNTNICHISKPGYTLIHASNGNWDAANQITKGIARQGTTDIIFLERAHTGPIQFTLLWARDD